MAVPEIPKALPDMEINYSIKLELNTGTNEVPAWEDMGVIFKNVAPALNEILFQASYYADEGWARSEVTGGQMITTFTGEVMPGDKVSDYLLDPERVYKFGNARKSALRITRGDEQIIWAVTLAKITAGMGDATNPNALTLEVHSNGKPSIGTVS